MGLKVYTNEHKEWLASFIPGHTCVEVAEEFNKRFELKITAYKVKCYKENHKIRSGTPHHRTKWSGPLWTPDRVEFLKAHNQGKTSKEVAQLMTKEFKIPFTDEQIKAVRARLKIKSGLSGRFKKDDPRCFHPPKGYHAPGAEKGWFKKGHTSWNHAKVGDEAWTTDGYLKVKIAEPNKWEFKHVLEWEKVHGPKPEGMMITFLDGDHANCSPDNLALITNEINGILNHQGMRSSDPEITSTAITLAKIKHLVRKQEANK